VLAKLRFVLASMSLTVEIRFLKVFGDQLRGGKRQDLRLRSRSWSTGFDGVGQRVEARWRP
jgi:hypothetical protein